MRTELPTSASFLVSENCNLACTYCFELACRNEKNMSKETAKKGIDYLIKNALTSGDKSIHVMFFGGEPLLNLEVVEYTFQYGLEATEKNGIKFTASMVTNATILNDEVKRVFKTYGPRSGFSLQLSADGIKEVHDKYRVTRGGQGSFDTIEKNIPGWKELFETTDGIDYSIHGCSNKETLPFLFKNYLFFRETWGIERIWFMPIHSEDWEMSDVKVYEEQLNLIADYVIKKSSENGNAKEVEFYAPIDRCLSNYGRPSAPCGAGKNFVTFTAEGLIAPCHQFYFNDPEGHSLIGDLDSGIDETKRAIYTNYEFKDIDCLVKNPNCEAVGCYMCIADNFNINGSMLSSPKGPRCAMSHVEKKIQDRVREELKNMGLFDKKGNYDSGDMCQCNSRNSGIEKNVEKECCGGGDDCKCGDKKETFVAELSEAVSPFNFEMLSSMALAAIATGEQIEKLEKRIKKLTKQNKKILKNSRGGKA